MSLGGGCIKCWDDPCTCGYDYKHWSPTALRELIATLKRVLREVIQEEKNRPKPVKVPKPKPPKMYHRGDRVKVLRARLIKGKVWKVRSATVLDTHVNGALSVVIDGDNFCTPVHRDDVKRVGRLHRHTRLLDGKKVGR